MDRKIGIIAPFVNEQFNADFALRLNNGIELTFKNILTIIKNNYDTDQTLKRIPDGINKFSAAGYYLSGFLRSHGFDTFLSAGEDEEALRKVASANPFAICISTSLINSKKFLKQLVNKVRSIMPEIPIIVGGILVWKSYLWYTKYSEENNSHPHHYRENQLCSEFLFPTTKTELDVDVFVISPDGCPTLLKVLQEFEKGRRADLSELPNLGLPARDGRFLLNPIIVEEIDQDSIITRWDLLDTLPMQIPIRTSIGCPYRCAYCDFCQLIPKVFFRPVDSLKKELDLLNRISSTGYHPTTNLFLTDDNVFCNEKRIAEVCNTIQESGLSKPWLGFLRASSINQSNIKMIKDSGLFCALVGIESGDKTQLHRMNRKQDVIQMKTGLEILDAAAICSIISLVIGFPGETIQSIDNTINFLNSLKYSNGFYSYYMFPFHLFPLSSIARPESRQKYNLKGVGSEWAHNTMSSHEVSHFMYQIFEKVIHLNYHYPSESYLFLGQFTIPQRKGLTDIRRRLTLEYIDAKSNSELGFTFKELSTALGVPNQPTPPAFFNEFAPLLTSKTSIHKIS